MPVNLVKGQNHVLNMNVFHVGLGWDVNVDASSEDFSTCAFVEFCRLYRYKGEWKIQATGVGHQGGLEELVNKYM